MASANPRHLASAIHQLAIVEAAIGVDVAIDGFRCVRERLAGAFHEILRLFAAWMKKEFAKLTYNSLAYRERASRSSKPARFLLESGRERHLRTIHVKA